MENFSLQIKNILSKYPDEIIVVLGKGASADHISKELLSKYLTIGLNDSELIGPVDITILTEKWALDSVQANDFKSGLYILPAEFSHYLPSGKSISAQRAEPARDEEEIFQHLYSSSLYLSNPLIISASSLAKKISEVSQKNIQVYFVGFDFDPESGYSRKIVRDNSQDSKSRKAGMLNSQVAAFQRMKYLLGESTISLNHVGNFDFSDISPAAFQAKFSSIDSSAKSTHFPSVEITAEITTNHLGDVEVARKMIHRAAIDGADYVKFQMRDVDSFYSKDQLNLPYRSPFGLTFRDYRQGLEFSDSQFMEINDICTEVGISWFASVLDMPSFRRVKNLGLKMVKLPSTISEKKSYLKYVSEEYSGTLVLSTGMTTNNYLEWVINTFVKQPKIYLLHANSAYPTPIEDCNIRVVSTYEKLALQDPRFVPGYSSHDSGNLGSQLAIAAGAKMLEKHVKWGNNPWLHFDSVALDLQTGLFGDYVLSMRETEVYLGDGIKRITKSEHHKY